jgi:hypothetical protein
VKICVLILGKGGEQASSTKKMENINGFRSKGRQEKMYRKTQGLAILGMMLLLAQAVHAAETPDAKVRITGKSVAAGVGFSWGSGVLTYQGKDYPFSVSGLSAGNIGVSGATLSGEVFNLKNIDDFNGNYTSAGAGATVAGGGGAMTMKNQNGVVMNVVGTTKGLSFKLGVDGMKVELKK